MISNNITTVSFGPTRKTVARPLWQYDYGQILKIEGLALPQSYEVHFSLTETGGTSVEQIGNADGVIIPDALLLAGTPIYAFIFLHTGADDGETEYKITIPVKARPKPSEEEPTPVQQDVITQAIAALNQAVEDTAEDAASAQASADAAATSEANASESAEYAAESARSAEASASAAAQSVITAEQKATQAAGSAENAAESATSASESAQAAAGSADDAEAAKDVILGMNAVAETLPAGSQATASYSNGTLTLGIPQGETGPQGLKGDTGATGPQGAKGDKGDTGVQGDKGDKGEKGDPGEKGDKGDPGEVSVAQLETALASKADIITGSATGAIASFKDGADDMPMKSCVVNIDPIQEGEGDPSPENVRPISGRTEVTVYHSGADTSDPTAISVNWETEAGEVYGGTLDVVSGKLTATQVKIKVSSRTWTKNSNYDRFLCGISDMITNKYTARTVPLKSSMALTITDGRALASVPNNCFYGAGGASRSVFFQTTDYTTPEAFLAVYGDSDLVYELAEPIEIQLTPQEIRTLLGVNNVWSDAGDVEAKYPADTKIYIDTKIAEAVAAMA